MSMIIDNLEQFDPKLGLVFGAQMSQKRKIYLYLQKIFVFLSRSTFGCQKCPSRTEAVRMFVILKNVYSKIVSKSVLMYAPMGIEEMFISCALHETLIFFSNRVK